MQESNKHPDVLVNRVAKSGLLTYDLERLYPVAETALFDIAPFLFKGLVLREKDFRHQLREHDWSQYTGKILLVVCSTDAIVPRWAYMLVAQHASPEANRVFFGGQEAYLEQYYAEQIAGLPIEPFVGRKVILKGCSDREVPTSAYVALTEKLLPVVDSLMYGEPCSTVPVYKKPKTR